MKILSNLPDTDAGTTERPDGAVKDVSSPGAGDGTPFRADWHNDHYYGLLAVMDSVGIAADDSDEEFEAGTGSSQFLSAMRLFVQEWAYPGLDFGLQNISGGNQTSDITIYESGGGSEKEDGFTVRLSWTGGDGTFAHSITSAYTIGNELAGFLASSAWQGDGAGELVLRLDKTNSKWLVLTPGIWDTDAGNFTGNFDKDINGLLRQYGTGTATASSDPNAIETKVLPIAAIDTNYAVNAVLNGKLATGWFAITTIDTKTTSQFLINFRDMDGATRSGSQTYDWTFIGRWI